MSVPLLSEAEVSELLKGVAPIQVDLNKSEVINSILTIRKWGFHAILDAVASATLSSKDALAETVKLAVQLSEFDFHLVERAVDRAGVDVCKSVLQQMTALLAKVNKSTDELEANRDAVFTVDGLRRTPGGIFWRMLKSQVPKEASAYIFKGNTKRQQGLRRQLVRDRWTENHLTVLTGPKRARQNEEVSRQVKTIKDIAAQLSMSEVSIIERVVVKKGIEYAENVLKEVNDVLAREVDHSVESLVMVSGEPESQRRRTPGGVFAQLVKGKADISESDKRFIFARATGGRAPSMSDLISMSLALKDRPPAVVRKVHTSSAPTAATTGSTTPAATEEMAWEYQRKVGQTWEPGFIGQETFSTDAFPAVDADKDSQDDIVSKIAIGLQLYSVEFVEQVVEAVGLDRVVQAYNETVAVERSGGMGITDSNNNRKRTPKGVFIAVLRRVAGKESVDAVIARPSAPPALMAPQVSLADSSTKISKLADTIIIELERMRIPDSDFEIVRNIVNLKGEQFVRSLFEKVRRRFNKGKWLDTPGQLFGKMLKTGLTNDELNAVFESSRTKQLVRTQRRALRKHATVILAPGEEKCAAEITLGLALIGVTANEVSVIERVISRLGEKAALRMLNRTREIEQEGGQRTRDEQRRKTPSGVFLSLLSSEEKPTKDDLKYIFEKPATSAEERKKEDHHFAPSLFTPVNPFRVIDKSGREPEFVESLKQRLRPALNSLEFISVVDPRLETVIRGVVLLGPSALALVDQCVHVFGEQRAEGWLEISHAQVAENKQGSLQELPVIYNDLVKAAGGLPSLETTAATRC